MRIRNNIIILLTLLLCSCVEEKKNGIKEQKTKQPVEVESDYQTELELNIDHAISAELFAREVLRENLRTHEFDLKSKNNPKHLKIFLSNGLEKVIAYSNKKYPKNSEPNYYEHYTLFVATFDNYKSAKATFERIKSDSKYGFLDWKELEKEHSERVKALNIGAKPGGFVTQSGKQILSLVETCREVPFGANWIEYETRLIKYLTRTGNEEFQVLNSDCGNSKYEFKIIKASR
jgi:hypothetical protein